MGILGVDFLKDFVLTIDNTKRTCTLRPSNNVAIADPATTHTLELIGDPPLPYIQGRIGGRAEQLFLIDKGTSNALAIGNEEFEQYSKAGLITDVAPATGLTLRGVTKVLVGRASAFQMNGVQHSRVGIVRSEFALIGMAYLQRFDMTLDFPRKLITVNRSTRYNRPDHTDWDGLNNATTGQIQITSDGLGLYTSNVPCELGSRIDFAQLVKNYASTQEETRYSPATITGIEIVPRFGNPDLDEVSTSYVERFNLTARTQLRRYTRLTIAHSKSFQHHSAMTALFIAWYSFCRKHETIRGKTPAMASGLTDHVWTIKELLQAAK